MGNGAGVFSYSQIDLWIRNQPSFRQLCMKLWEVSVKVKGRRGTCTCLLETNHAKPIHRDISHKLQQNLRCLQGCLSGDNQRQHSVWLNNRPLEPETLIQDLIWSDIAVCFIVVPEKWFFLCYISKLFNLFMWHIILPEMVIINNYLK